MNPKTTKAVAKFIAILLVGALVITSFTLVFSWAGSPQAVYAAGEEKIDWDEELTLIKDLIIETKLEYKDEVSYSDLIHGALGGVIDSLGDPYSVFYGSENESKQFEESVSGEFYGVGVSLEQVNGVCKVVAPIPGTPAEKAGVLSGDIVVGVDGSDVTEMTLQQIVDLLKGKNLLKGADGTNVSMTVLRGSNTITFSMIREKIRVASVNHELLSDNIGYIRIAQFDSDAHLEFKEAKLKLLAAGAKSFIVDLRNNPGGYVGTAADIAEQLMPGGPIVHFQKQGVITETISADGRGDLRFPVIVLVNGGSASASEILAAALKDSGRAKLVGTQTYGKGVAQQIVSVAGESKMKLSTYYFLGPNKGSINKTGITPDYIVSNYETIDADKPSELYDKYKGFAPMIEKTKPKLGDTGLNVFGAQQRLSLLGYKLNITGVMDADTVTAVKSLQKVKGLSPYGVLDYSTMGTLDKAALEYVSGVSKQKDLQLEKAIELLK